MTDASHPPVLGGPLPADRQNWWHRVGAALRPHDPVLPARGQCPGAVQANATAGPGDENGFFHAIETLANWPIDDQ